MVFNRLFKIYPEAKYQYTPEIRFQKASPKKGISKGIFKNHFQNPENSLSSPIYGHLGCLCDLTFRNSI